MLLVTLFRDPIHLILRTDANSKMGAYLAGEETPSPAQKPSFYCYMFKCIMTTFVMISSAHTFRIT
jgi:hypothetical protein